MINKSKRALILMSLGTVMLCGFQVHDAQSRPLTHGEKTQESNVKPEFSPPILPEAAYRLNPSLEPIYVPSEEEIQSDDDFEDIVEPISLYEEEFEKYIQTDVVEDWIEDSSDEWIPEPSYIYEEPQYVSENYAPLGQGVRFEATAYEVGGLTATGLPAEPGVIAVDPSVIPLGSTVYVEVPGYPELSGSYIAADTGGAINGNIIDICMYSGHYEFGRRDVYVSW